MSVKKSVLRYGIAAVVLAVVVTLVGSGFFTSLLPAGGNSGAESLYIVQLTDPPTVPNGTLWLNLTYTNIELHAENSSQWISTGASGTVDLLLLQNVSKTIASTYVPTGDVINVVRIDVSSAIIDINKTTSSVNVPSDQLTVPLVGSNRVSGIAVALLDFMPTVHGVSGGSNSQSYFMVPSVVGIVKQSSEVGKTDSTIGHESQLTQADKTQLSDASASLKVSSPSLSVSGTQTSFEITLTNEGSSNFTFYMISLNGNYSSSVSVSCPPQASKCAPAQSLTHEDEVLFVWSGTGGLLTQLKAQPATGPTGLTIQPGESVTLSFSGVLVSGSTSVTLQPISGNQYSGQVEASNGATQSFSVTAS